MPLRTKSGLWFQIRTFRKLRDGFQAAAMVAMAHEQRAAAHIEYRILLEPGSDLAGLLEFQRSGIWGVALHFWTASWPTIRRHPGIC